MKRNMFALVVLLVVLVAFPTVVLAAPAAPQASTIASIADMPPADGGILCVIFGYDCPTPPPPPPPPPTVAPSPTPKVNVDVAPYNGPELNWVKVPTCHNSCAPFKIGDVDVELQAGPGIDVQKIVYVMHPDMATVTVQAKGGIVTDQVWFGGQLTRPVSASAVQITVGDHQPFVLKQIAGVWNVALTSDVAKQFDPSTLTCGDLMAARKHNAATCPPSQAPNTVQTKEGCWCSTWNW